MGVYKVRFGGCKEVCLWVGWGGRFRDVDNTAKGVASVHARCSMSRAGHTHPGDFRLELISSNLSWFADVHVTYPTGVDRCS